VGVMMRKILGLLQKIDAGSPFDASSGMKFIDTHLMSEKSRA
jgi:hypothetical protein